MSRNEWMMTQAWLELLFLHWPVAPAEIRSHIPAQLELDLYDKQAWIGIVLFKARGTRPRFLPSIPGTANFLEVNVRTYVKYNNRSGVYFFSLDANSQLAVTIASFQGFLPYRKAKMAFNNSRGIISFRSKTLEKDWTTEKIALEFRVSNEQAVSTDLELWLTERYCLWTKFRQRLWRLDIEHEPWKLQYVNGTITENTMAPYLGINFSEKAPMAHYAAMKNVRFYPPIMEK